MADEPAAGEQRLLFAVEEEPVASEPDLTARVRQVRTSARRSRSVTTLAERDVEVREIVEESVLLETAAVGPTLADALPEETEAAPETLSVADFYERVRRALKREFTDEVWVTGEIRGLRESKGHHYIELADAGSPTGRGVAPQLEVACWARQWPRIARELDAAGVSLEVGRVIRVRGQVSVWEGAGKLRFSLSALDVESLIGNIAATRRRLLIALEAEGLLDANRRLGIPLVPLRIGIVTSPGSEGERDFVGQLERSGFRFEIHFRPSFVQGPEAPGQLVAALRALEAYELDLAVVVRGGGARGDLACFDDEAVARAIASASFPIWTGIGHTGDRSVADEVAQLAFITPTACGEAIVDAVGSYWDATARSAQAIHRLASRRLERAEHALERDRAGLSRAAGHRLELATGRLGAARERLARAALHRLDTAAHAAARDAQVLRAFDPRRQFERGWSLTRDRDGRLVRSIAHLAAGEELETRLADGSVVSVVASKTERQ